LDKYERGIFRKTSYFFKYHFNHEREFSIIGFANTVYRGNFF
jgi:hypothetical protein